MKLRCLFDFKLTSAQNVIVQLSLNYLGGIYKHSNLLNVLV
jgi:hypothetical protein